ncbi:hypothetical protein CYMTET_45480 [Cymbomonas tetramitiformis]|uniref:Uncharacterized protein n=1 Tax=Cymbomonas tetramitiformis TaxID=36881 RepID=A0AAE0EYJ9_9CHLO|nr:hypothetical protein CYMTET_45480 [Cymbomonas tetramitiformis]
MRVAVTWHEVPEYASGGANTFQAVLYLMTGVIQLSWEMVSVTHAVVGVSPGWLPQTFHTTDLSEAVTCSTAAMLHLRSPQPPSPFIPASAPFYLPPPRIGSAPAPPDEPASSSTVATPTWLFIGNASASIHPGEHHELTLLYSVPAGEAPLGSYTASVWITSATSDRPQGLPADLVVAMYVVEADCGLQAQTRGTTQDNLAADSTEEGAAHQIKLLPFSDGNLDPQELPESQQINWGGGTQRVNFTARLKWAVSPFALTMDLDQLWSLVEVENGQVMSTEQDARCRGLETLVQGRVWLGDPWRENTTALSVRLSYSGMADMAQYNHRPLVELHSTNTLSTGYGDCTEAEQILVVAVFSKPVSALHTSHFEVGPGAWVHAVDRMPQSATSFHQNYFHVLVRFDPHFLGSTYLAVNGGAAMDAFGAPNQPSQRIKLQRLDQLSIHMHSTYKVNVNRFPSILPPPPEPPLPPSPPPSSPPPPIASTAGGPHRFSCYNWLVAGFNTTGRYYIDRGGEVSEGHCEQEVADGGWELLSIVQASSRASAGLFGLERCADINALHCKGNLNVLADGPPDEALAGMPDAELLIQSLDNRSVWGVFTGFSTTPDTLGLLIDYATLRHDISPSGASAF